VPSVSVAAQQCRQRYDSSSLTLLLHTQLPVLLASSSLLLHNSTSLTLHAALSLPSFAPDYALHRDVLLLLVHPSLLERPPRTLHLSLPSLRLLSAPAVEVERNPLTVSHHTTLAVSLVNSAPLPLVFTRLALAEGAARYLGPAGAEAVDFGLLFSAHVDESYYGTVLGPNDVLQVLVSIRPKPLAYERYTDWHGSFGTRLVVTWTAQHMQGAVLSSADVFWRGPRSSDLMVACRFDTGPRNAREVFNVDVTVNNVSDTSRTLALDVGNATVAVDGRRVEGDNCSLLCLDHTIMLGAVAARSKVSVLVRFIALRSGIFEVSNIKLTDHRDSHVLVDPWVIDVGE
jgi:hypothetical protein